MDDNWYFRMVDSAADAREYLTQHPRVSVQVASFMAVRWVPDLCVPVPVRPPSSAGWACTPRRTHVGAPRWPLLQ